MQGELDRLREEQRQAERANRQGTYHRTLAVLDRMDMFATGSNEESKADYMAVLEEFNNMVGGIHLFGAEQVREALGPLTSEMERLGARIVAYQRDESMPYAVAYPAAYPAGAWRSSRRPPTSPRRCARTSHGRSSTSSSRTRVLERCSGSHYWLLLQSYCLGEHHAVLVFDEFHDCRIGERLHAQVVHGEHCVLEGVVRL